MSPPCTVHNPSEGRLNEEDQDDQLIEVSTQRVKKTKAGRKLIIQEGREAAKFESTVMCSLSSIIIF